MVVSVFSETVKSCIHTNNPTVKNQDWKRGYEAFLIMFHGFFVNTRGLILDGTVPGPL